MNTNPLLIISSQSVSSTNANQIHLELLTNGHQQIILLNVPSNIMTTTPSINTLNTLHPLNTLNGINTVNAFPSTAQFCYIASVLP